MEFDDVSDILRNVEWRIKDGIKIPELLPFLAVSEHSSCEIRAQYREHGGPHASSKFFDSIRSRPDSLCTLVAALLKRKINQKWIHDIILKEIKKRFRKKPNKLQEVLKKIEDEKRRLDVEDDSASDSDGNGGGGGRPARSQLQSPQGTRSKEPSLQISLDIDTGGRPARSQLHIPQGARNKEPSLQITLDSNTDERPRVVPPGLASSESEPTLDVLYRRHQEPDPSPSSLPARAPGQGVALRFLKSNIHRKLARELEKKGRDNEAMWIVISEEVDDLDISFDDTEKIESSSKPGTEFLRLLDRIGYTTDDLERMFGAVGMREAIAILGRNQNEVVPRYNNLNMPISSDNKILNIGSPDDNENRRNSSPINFGSQVSISSASSHGNYSSVSSIESNSLRDLSGKPTKSVQPMQSVGDRENRYSAPNTHMDADKLRQDMEDVSLNQHESSCRSIEREEPLGSQVSISSASSHGNYSSVSSIESNSLPDLSGKPTKSVQPMQSVGDRENRYSAPNTHMDADKLRQDMEDVSLNQPESSCRSIEREEPLDKDTNSRRSTPTSRPSNTRVTNAETLPTTASSPAMNIPGSAIEDNSRMASPYDTPSNSLVTDGETWPTTDSGRVPTNNPASTVAVNSGSQASTSVSVSNSPGSSMSTYADDSSDFRVHEDINRDASAPSLSMSTISDASVTDLSLLKGTRALQPTSDREVHAADTSREAEKLRYDRVHQLDDHPSALSSFTDIKQVTGQGHAQGQGQAREAGSHTFRSTLAEPYILSVENRVENFDNQLHTGQSQDQVLEGSQENSNALRPARPDPDMLSVENRDENSNEETEGAEDRDENSNEETEGAENRLERSDEATEGAEGDTDGSHEESDTTGNIPMLSVFSSNNNEHPPAISDPDP